MEQVVITSINKQELVDIIEQTVKKVFGTAKNEDPIPNEKPIGVKRAANILLLSGASIYRKCNNLEIPHFKRGNRLYFYESELEAYLKDGRKLSTDQIDQLSDLYLKQ